jgi:transposase-like protein
MSGKIKYKRIVLVLITITAIVCLLSQCITQKNKNETTIAPAVFEDYSGSEKCAACHKDIYKNHISTAHYHTGQPATANFLKGHFEKGKNTYSYTPSLVVSMEKRDSGFYQVVTYKGEEKIAMRFDMVIGSGVMGQSFLTTRNNRLYQLPITWFTAANQWSISPGFPLSKVMIDRPVTARCLECHATYAQSVSGTEMEPLEFDYNKILYGVSCEKCHGPAAKHIEYHISHTADSVPKFIVNPAALSRQQQLDVCALCHGGKIPKTKPSFQFTAGKKLSDYFITDTLSDNAVKSGNVDVHGNQYGLLRASKCFRMSSAMTCNTCHNSHKNERGNDALFSSRCTGCHSTTANEFKTPTHKQVTNIQNNCIDCHMPSQDSRAIAVFLEGAQKLVASKLRTHFIGIYDEETKKFIAKMKKGK